MLLHRQTGRSRLLGPRSARYLRRCLRVLTGGGSCFALNVFLLFRQSQSRSVEDSDAELSAEDPAANAERVTKPGMPAGPVRAPSAAAAAVTAAANAVSAASAAARAEVPPKKAKPATVFPHSAPAMSMAALQQLQQQQQPQQQYAQMLHQMQYQQHLANTHMMQMRQTQAQAGPAQPQANVPVPATPWVPSQPLPAPADALAQIGLGPNVLRAASPGARAGPGGGDGAARPAAAAADDGSGMPGLEADDAPNIPPPPQDPTTLLVPPPPPGGAGAAPSESVTLVLVGRDSVGVAGKQFVYRVSTQMLFGRLIQTFAKHVQLAPAAVHLRWHGRLLLPEESPGQLGMVDDERIVVQLTSATDPPPAAT